MGGMVHVRSAVVGASATVAVAVGVFFAVSASNAEEQVPVVETPALVGHYSTVESQDPIVYAPEPVAVPEPVIEPAPVVVEEPVAPKPAPVVEEPVTQPEAPSDPGATPPPGPFVPGPPPPPDPGSGWGVPGSSG